MKEVMKKDYVAVVGSRGFSIARRDEVRKVIEGLPRGTVVVTGDCPTGVDLEVRDTARHRGLVVVQCMAPWDIGHVAGDMRNQVIADISKMLCGIWDGNSPGTANVLAHGRAFGKPIDVRKLG